MPPDLKGHMFVVLNPIAGQVSLPRIQKAFHRHISNLGWTFEIHTTSGGEDIPGLVHQACARGADVVVAAGGDGTVAAVGTGVARGGVPMGILPVGTGNGLARALRIPLNLDRAIALLFSEQTTQHVDGMRIGDRFFFLNVSVGISARAVRQIRPDQKRRMGIIAYVWTIIWEWISFRPRRFRLQQDGRRRTMRATEILISNGTLLERPNFPLGPPATFSDGQVEVYVLSARSILDYLRLIWDLLQGQGQDFETLQTLHARERIVLDAIGRPQPVQADGDSIGQTPVEIQIVPGAITVIVPRATPGNMG